MGEADPNAAAQLSLQSWSSCPTSELKEEGAGSGPGTKSCTSSCILLPLRNPEVAGLNQTQPPSKSSLCPLHPSTTWPHPLLPWPQFQAPLRVLQMGQVCPDRRTGECLILATRA